MSGFYYISRVLTGHPSVPVRLPHVFIQLYSSPFDTIKIQNYIHLIHISAKMSQEGSSKRSRERNGQVKKSPSTKASSLETEALQLQQKKLEEDIELLNNR